MRSLLLAAGACALPLAAPAAAQCELDLVHAATGQPYDFFGRSVAIDGSLAAVGAPQDPSQLPQGTGKVDVFARPPAGGAWVHQVTLLASDGAIGDRFGEAVAVSNERVLVGAPGHKSGLVHGGAAYVFERDDMGTPGVPADDVWLEVRLAPPSPASGDALGEAVALVRDTAVVSAPGRDHGSGNVGSVFTFERGAGAWASAAELLPADPGPWENFGTSVALAGDTVLAGSTKAGALVGAAWVFDRDDLGTPSDPLDDVWIQTATLTAADSIAQGHFGWSCALGGDVAVVGAEQDDDLGSWSGSAYVYTRSDAGTPGDPFDDTWSPPRKLLASDGAGLDRFGCALAQTEDVTIVGALGDEGFRGAAYVFARDRRGTPSDPADDLWVERHKLVGSTASTAALFGGALAIADGLVVAGSEQNKAPSPGLGAAFVFGVPRRLPLAATPWTLSLAAGGRQALDLDAGPCAAGSLYLVLGSTSGTSPGWPGPPLLPLNYDAYTLLTLTSTSWPIAGGLGLLDAEGRGRATIRVPPGTNPTLAGLHADHAFLVLELPSGALTLGSNARPLDLLP